MGESESIIGKLDFLEGEGETRKFEPDVKFRIAEDPILCKNSVPGNEEVSNPRTQGAEGRKPYAPNQIALKVFLLGSVKNLFGQVPSSLSSSSMHSDLASGPERTWNPAAYGPA